MARIPDCACLDVRILGPKRNLDHRSFFSLGGMLMSSSKLLFFPNEVYLNSGVRLFLELYNIIAIKYAAFFTICAKLTMAFTFTSLLSNFYTSVSGYDCGFGFQQKYWRIDGFGGKKARIGGFA